MPKVVLRRLKKSGSHAIVNTVPEVVLRRPKKSGSHAIVKQCLRSFYGALQSLDPVPLSTLRLRFTVRAMTRCRETSEGWKYRHAPKPFTNSVVSTNAQCPPQLAVYKLMLINLTLFSSLLSIALSSSQGRLVAASTNTRSEVRERPSICPHTQERQGEEHGRGAMHSPGFV